MRILDHLDLLDDLVLDVDVRSLTAILIDDQPSFDEDPEKTSELMKTIYRVLVVVGTCCESSGDEGREA